MRQVNYLTVAIFLCCVLAGHAVELGEMRTWTSVSGAKVQAQFVELQGNFAVLKSDAGKDFKIGLGNLSGRDQEYILSLTRNTGSPSKKVAWPAGEIIKDVVVEDEPEWSYLLYLPRNFTPNREWPVLYILGPCGGSEYDVRRYVKGAEFNGWILAMSTQRRNNFKGSGTAIRAMDRHVRQTLPINEDMMFITGMSGGARAAFWYASKKGRDFADTKDLHFAGVLACGAGTKHPLARKTATYGLCGSNCFNRWDMACTFQNLKNRDWRLRFFPGNHDWANDDLLMDAMCWLEGYYLKKIRSSDLGIAARRQAYMERMVKLVEEIMESDPERAYDCAAFLVDFPVAGPAHVRMNECLQELLKKPAVQLYVEGLKDMEKFVDKFYGQSKRDRKERNGAPDVKKAADKYAAEYAGTSLEDVFRRMGLPCVEP